MNENATTLVFKLDGEAVHAERHLRANGDFTSRVPPRETVNRTAAKFVMVPSPGVMPDESCWIYPLKP